MLTVNETFQHSHYLPWLSLHLQNQLSVALAEERGQMSENKPKITSTNKDCKKYPQVPSNKNLIPNSLIAELVLRTTWL